MPREVREVDARREADRIRGDVARAELAELGLKYFLDVRATVRRILEHLPRTARAAFAAAVAERLLRAAEQAPPAERPAYVVAWRPVLDAVWRGLSGDQRATRDVAIGVGRFYLSAEFDGRRHDDASDAADHGVMAGLYAAECFLHGCADFAEWAGWRGFDAAAVHAAADRSWPDRAPTGLSGYTWELAHPAIQAELDQQMADLELLSSPPEPESPPELGSLPPDRLTALRSGPP